MTTRKKLLLTSVLMLAISSISISGALIVQSYHAMLEKTVRLTYASLDSVAVSLENSLLVQRATLNSLKGYAPLHHYLSAEYRTDYDNYEHFTRYVYPTLRLMQESSGGMRIRIYSRKVVSRFSGMIGGTVSQLVGADWYDEGASQQSGCAWATTAMRINGKRQQALCCYVTLRDGLSEVESVIAVFQGEDTLRTLFEPIEGKTYFLLDGAGKVVTSSIEGAAGMDGEALRGQYGSAILPSASESVISFGGTDQLVLLRALPDDAIGLEGWMLCTLVPYAQITGEITGMIRNSMLITGAVLMASMTLIALITGNLTHGFAMLMKRIAVVSGGNFDVGKPMSGRDEIARVSRSFDSMVCQVRALIEENEAVHRALIEKNRVEHEVVIRQQEAELMALRAQINPHFLFNTLESIRMRLLLKGDRETAGIMVLFSDNIRACMSTGQNLTVLEDELQFVQRYVTIQKYRFGDRLRFDMDVPESLYGQMIPRLMLQPIIENAIQHGLGGKVGPGWVRLSASQSGRRISFVVEDDGAGMEAEALDALRALLESGEAPRGHAHLGLQNVQRRIRLLYGEDYGLSVDARSGEGMRVRLDIEAKGDD